MAILESVFGNPNQSPNALMRFGAALQGPDAQRLMFDMQKQSQLQGLLSKMSNVPQNGMGPQKPLPPKEFLTQLAGITGDVGGLASYLVSEQEQQAKMEARKQLQDLVGRTSPVGANGPQQPINDKEFIRGVAGLTGDTGGLADLLVAEQKNNAETQRQKQIAGVIGGQSPLQSFAATAGNSSGANPLSVRNNNAGNIRDSKTGDFRKFPTPEEGLNAMKQDLTAKISGNSPAMASKFGQGYTPTLANVISTWAPPEENDTQAYIQTVSQKTGIRPDQPLTLADIEKIQPAMIEQEGGQAASEYFGGNNQQTEVPQSLSKLASLAQIDPETYGDDYLYAQAKFEENKLKESQESVKAAKQGIKDLTEGESTLRKEFEGLADVKQFRDVEGAYQRVLKATQNPSAAGDIALIFNYMKMLDPGSTVREGEFATAASAAGIPTQIMQQYNKALSGERLAPEQRADFLNQAGGQYKAAEDLFIERAGDYEKLAEGYSYKPDRVVRRARGKTPTLKATAAVDPKLLEFMTPEERALFKE